VSFFVLLMLATTACISSREKNGAASNSVLPPGVTTPAAMLNNNNPAKIELGRYLFFDRRLSFNNTRSCASCHDPRFAFTDGYRRSQGATADLHQRNAQPLFNLAFLERLTSADTSLHTPQQQMQNPLFNEKNIELGVKGHETVVVQRLQPDSLYQQLFSKAFPELQQNMQLQQVIEAIAAFITTIVSSQSAYDRYTYYGEKKALDASALRGRQLFFSNELKCSQCHSGFNFSDGLQNRNLPLTERLYFNTGLYNINGTGAYPAYDPGLAAQTGKKEDMGKIRVPTLRNLGFTGPYLHDGSMSTLDEVVETYARGGRDIDYGEYKGDGKLNPYKSELLKGFVLSVQEKKDLVHFLFSLSDSSLLTNPAYQNPWENKK
jgi:cytochrome c peroxidase